MKFSQILAPLATAVALATGALSQLVVNTPTNVVACEPVLLTWSGGEAPYFLVFLPGGHPDEPALVDFGQQTGTSLTWLVNLAAGINIGISIRDSNGEIANSASITIRSGSDTSCLNH
ncbi:hypothetical protein BDZ94DRAFT_1249514 [Collybia nuda]|uniref:Uncharacterized protein n=1 Tax=Collybia nuda TaxID=64659 RepID=A0A9P5YDU9_9AGAR|nr:hypothetical protein BDZ94DRAFT_1249514 [Collybia nuda]